MKKLVIIIITALTMAISEESVKAINQAIVAEYTDQYCLGLEAAYGNGMMSDGGSVAIEKMFSGVVVSGKITVDIGAGLGGVAFHLAKNYGTQVTGIEINPWMVEEANRRVPDNLKHLVKFVLLTNDDILPFPDNSVDIFYSKGVLTHVEKKEPLFREVIRVLKPGGLFLINDWLSPIVGQWGNFVKNLIDLEHLTLFAETDTGYIEVLTKAGFINTSITDATRDYSNYNREIVAQLRNLPAEKQHELDEKFGITFAEDAAKGYESIANAMEAGELLVRTIHTFKPS